MNSPVDLTQLERRPLSGSLGELELQAANFIRSFAWSGELLELYEGFQEPEIIGVFLVHLRPAAPNVDEWLWIVVGDLPPAYLVADGYPTWKMALAGYVEEMQRWVDATKAGRPVDELIRVNTPPTREYAEMLESRLRTLQETLLDPRRTLLHLPHRRATSRPPIEDETLWALRHEDGTFEVESIPIDTHEVAVGDIVNAETDHGKLRVTEVIRKSKNSVLHVVPADIRQRDKVCAEAEALGCECETEGGTLAVHVPAEVEYAPVHRLFEEAQRAGRLTYETLVLRHPTSTM